VPYAIQVCEGVGPLARFPDRFAQLVRYAIQVCEGVGPLARFPDRFAQLVPYAIQACEGVGRGAARARRRGMRVDGRSFARRTAAPISASR
jgi:hypothetical protein